MMRLDNSCIALLFILQLLAAAFPVSSVASMSSIEQVRQDAAQYGDYGSKSRLRPVLSLLSQQQYDQALQKAAAMLAVRPNDASLHFLTGLAHYFRNNDSQAINSFSMALQIDTSRGDACFYRSLSYRRSGQPAKALEDISTAIYQSRTIAQLTDLSKALNGQNAASMTGAQLYFWRATCNRDLGRSDAALNDINQAINNGPVREDFYLFRSQLHYARRQLDPATTDLHSCIRMSTPGSPNASAAWNLLGIIEFIRGNYPQALDYYRKAAPDNPVTKINIAVALWLNGEHDKGFSLLQELKGQMDDAVFYYHYGYLLHLRGEQRQARSNFAKAQEKNPAILQQRRGMLDSTPSNSATRKFYQQELQTAQAYLNNQTPPGTATSTPKLEMTSLRIEPDPVPADTPSAILIDFTCSSAENRAHIDVELFFTVTSKGKQLFKSPPIKLSAENGVSASYRVRLDPINAVGQYQIKAFLKYGKLIVTREVVLRAVAR
jgi:tetratricopeptide (TPR) repeat protein